MKTLSLLILLPLLSVTNVESNSNLILAKNSKIQKSDQLVQYFQLEMSINIPANSIPKKSFITVSSEVGGYAFKSFSFQDVKAMGNGQAIAIESDAELHYADKIPDENYTANIVNVKSGRLTIEIMNKKGKVSVSTYDFEWGVATRIYFDEKQTTYFTITPSYSLVDEL